MRGLKCDEAEARKVYAYDCKIEKGEATEHDLPDDKAKIAQKLAHTGTRKAPTVYNFTKKRERKPNATKGGIITELFNHFNTDATEFAVTDVTILNKERQISFRIGDDTFELTLVQKRKPK